MKLLVIGSNGQVGWELVRCLLPLGNVVAVDHRQMDLSDFVGIKNALKDIAPDVIVNAGAYTAVDKAEGDEAVANIINGHAPGVLAREAKRIGALLIHYSTDYVFDGKKPAPYTEGDIPNPVNVYGRSKLLGEEEIQAVDGDYIILRTSWVYAARGENFLRTFLRLAQERDELNIIVDQVGAPTWARLVAECTAHIIRQSKIDGAGDLFQSGVYHLTAASETSWFGFAQAILEQARRSPRFPLVLNSIVPIPSEDYPALALRPKNSRLDSTALERKFKLRIPDWKQSMIFCMNDIFPSGVRA